MFSKNTYVVLICLLIVIGDFCAYECSNATITSTYVWNGRVRTRAIPIPDSQVYKYTSPTGISDVTSPVPDINKAENDEDKYGRQSIYKGEDEGVNDIDSECIFYMSMPNNTMATSFLNKEKSSTPFKPIQKTPTIEIEQRKPVFNPVEARDQVLYKRPPRTPTPKGNLRKFLSPFVNVSDYEKKSLFADVLATTSPLMQMIDAPLPSVSEGSNTSEIKKERTKKKKVSQTKEDVDYYGFPGWESDSEDSIDDEVGHLHLSEEVEEDNEAGNGEVFYFEDFDFDNDEVNKKAEEQKLFDELNNYGFYDVPSVSNSPSNSDREFEELVADVKID